MSHFLLLWMMTGPALARPPVTIVCLGDSVTKGVRMGVKAEETFCALLEKKLKAAGIRAKVINAGVGGHTTADALQRFDRDVLGHKPSHVVIMFGLNDSWVDQGKTTSRLTAKEYGDNLRKMVATLKKKEIFPLLMTPNPVIAPTYLAERNVRLKKYVNAMRSVARDEKVRLVDAYALFGELGLEGVPLNSMFTDAMHPNSRGHEAIAGLLINEFKDLLKSK
jgi:lysophospholipase L1-like esterase